MSSQLVCVLRTNDAVKIAIAKSLLEEASLYYYVKNEDSGNIFGYIPLITDMRLLVRGEDQGLAEALLQTLKQNDDE